MTKSIVILGRQPALGLAELESLYGTNVLRQISDNSALVDLHYSKIDFTRLGGSIKLGKLLTTLPASDWGVIAKSLRQVVTDLSTDLPAGKITLGLSVYGLKINPSRINATALEIKKLLKTSGRSVRIIPNKTADLSSAQVLHNNLCGERAMELIIVAGGDKTFVARTTNVQNITAYAGRDQVRPMRDAKVGMLPPKLAQIIINLANPAPNSTVLDPFCGTGVILQEALLMGLDALGSDLEPRMIEYSAGNLNWLKAPSNMWQLAVGDACNKTWDNFGAVACEAYLGRPFSALPGPQILAEVMYDVDVIIKKFLINLARQTSSGMRMCIAVPAWKTAQGFAHLKVLDNLGDLGYNRIRFESADSSELIYHRPEQVVARELVVLIRK